MKLSAFRLMTPVCFESLKERRRKKSWLGCQRHLEGAMTHGGRAIVKLLKILVYGDISGPALIKLVEIKYCEVLWRDSLRTWGESRRSNLHPQPPRPRPVLQVSASRVGGQPEKDLRRGVGLQSCVHSLANSVSPQNSSGPSFGFCRWCRTPARSCPC